jgi:hypothetical protein
MTDDTDYSLWKATKGLKQPTQRIPPVRKTDQTWARSDKEKANNFAAHSKNIFISNQMSHNEELEKEINRPLEEPLQITNQIKFFTPKVIKNYKKILTQGKPQDMTRLQGEF